jgi:hypothetical protein
MPPGCGVLRYNHLKCNNGKEHGYTRAVRDARWVWVLPPPPPSRLCHPASLRVAQVNEAECIAACCSRSGCKGYQWYRGAGDATGDCYLYKLYSGVVAPTVVPAPGNEYVCGALLQGPPPLLIYIVLSAAASVLIPVAAFVYVAWGREIRARCGRKVTTAEASSDVIPPLVPVHTRQGHTMGSPSIPVATLAVNPMYCPGGGATVAGPASRGAEVELSPLAKSPAGSVVVNSTPIAAVPGATAPHVSAGVSSITDAVLAGGANAAPLQRQQYTRWTFISLLAAFGILISCLVPCVACAIWCCLYKVLAPFTRQLANMACKLALAGCLLSCVLNLLVSFGVITLVFTTNEAALTPAPP